MVSTKKMETEDTVFRPKKMRPEESIKRETMEKIKLLNLNNTHHVVTVEGKVYLAREIESRHFVIFWASGDRDCLQLELDPFLIRAIGYRQAIKKSHQRRLVLSDLTAAIYLPDEYHMFSYCDGGGLITSKDLSVDILNLSDLPRGEKIFLHFLDENGFLPEENSLNHILKTDLKLAQEKEFNGWHWNRYSNSNVSFEAFAFSDEMKHGLGFSEQLFTFRDFKGED